MKHNTSGCRARVEVLERRLQLSDTLFSDNFTTTGRSSDINALTNGSARPTGLFGTSPYVEEADPGNGSKNATYAGQQWDSLTVVNPDAQHLNTLLLATSEAVGIKPAHRSTYVATTSSVFDPKYGLNEISVTVTPYATGTVDHWAGIKVGGDAAGSMTTAGTAGVRTRADGTFEIYDNGTRSGLSHTLAGATTFLINYIIHTNGSYTLTVSDANSLSHSYTQTISHGAFTGYVSLLDASAAAPAGTQYNDYYDDFKLEGNVNSAVAGQTYYVSTSDGNDANDGSMAHPWKTVSRVNATEFGPDNHILFKRGDVFQGTLNLSKHDSGSVGHPLTIGSYGGTGSTATINALDGDAIALHDAHDIAVNQLILTGSGTTTNTGSGIHLYSDVLKPVLSGYTFSNVTATKFGHEGIDLSATFYYDDVNLKAPKKNLDLSDVSVSYSHLDYNGEGGLLVYGVAKTDTVPPPGDSIYIDHVRAKQNLGSNYSLSGFGILVFGESNVVIQNCLALGNGKTSSGGQCGAIQLEFSDCGLLQYNVASGTTLGKSDADGMVIDSSTHSIMQYNYTHDNDGPGLWLGAENNSTTANNVIRYNISQNDGLSQKYHGGIYFWTGDNAHVNSSDVYGNTVYSSSSSSTNESAAIAFARDSGDGTSKFVGDDLFIHNNILTAAGGSKLVNYPGGATKLVFRGNDYWTYGAAFQVKWGSTLYSSLASWHTVTDQENKSDTDKALAGFNTDPMLAGPGTGGDIVDYDQLSTLSSSYKFQAAGSPFSNGANATIPVPAWDPFSYASTFVGSYFDAMPEDFFGVVMPVSGPWSVGASR